MKKLFLLFLFLLPVIVSAQIFSQSSLSSVASITPSVEDMPVSIFKNDFVADERRSCDGFSDLIDLVSKNLVDNLNFSNDSFVNVTNKYCWNSDERTSVNVNLLVKNESDSLIGKRISFNFYVNDVVDYTTVFSQRENLLVGYSLKEKYLEYLVNGSDESVYVSITPDYVNKEYDCVGLKSFYDSLSSDVSNEVYFNQENKDYCQLIAKISVSDIKNYVRAGYVNYFGEEVRFSFDGFSVGEYDLSVLKDSLACDIKEGYDFDDLGSCYGVFKDENRVYFNAYKEFGKSSVSVNVYGFIDGNARIRVSVYGEDAESVLSQANAFVSGITLEYFGKDLVPEIKLDEYQKRFVSSYDFKSYTGSAKITNLGFNRNALSGLEKNEDKMNTYYSSEVNNVYLTVSVPYIQVFYNKLEEQVIEGGSDVIEKGIAFYPYPGQNSFVITKDKVFSQVIVDENDFDLAVNEIKSVLDAYVNSSEWVLDLWVIAGGYYPYPILYETSTGSAVRTLAIDVAEVRSLDSGLISSSSSLSGGFEDKFLSDFPDFNELIEEQEVVEKKSFFSFIKYLFGV